MRIHSQSRCSRYASSGRTSTRHADRPTRTTRTSCQTVLAPPVLLASRVHTLLSVFRDSFWFHQGLCSSAFMVDRSYLDYSHETSLVVTILWRVVLASPFHRYLLPRSVLGRECIRKVRISPSIPTLLSSFMYILRIRQV